MPKVLLVEEFYDGAYLWSLSEGNPKQPESMEALQSGSVEAESIEQAAKIITSELERSKEDCQDEEED